MQEAHQQVWRPSSLSRFLLRLPTIGCGDLESCDAEECSLGQDQPLLLDKGFPCRACPQAQVRTSYGGLLDTHGGYTLQKDSLKKLLVGKKTLNDLTDDDLDLNIRQKGVGMKLGLDIASLAYGGIVNQVIMIAGDSDFVPAAKMARRQGIDFILDPMWSHITSSLNLHIDGLETCCKKPSQKN